MNIIYGFFIFVEALLSIMLIGVILIQKTKGGMGGTAFGGGMGEAIFGSRMGNVLTKTTVVLGIVFLINTLILTALTSRRAGGVSVTDQIPVQPVTAPVQQPAAAPAPAPMEQAAPVEPAAPAAPIDLPAVETTAADSAPAAPEVPAAGDAKSTE